jgi:hypothetical protein
MKSRPVKLRHAATIALLGGWYLLVPNMNNLDAPLSSRLLFASYDTAKECEDAKLRLGKMIKAGTSKTNGTSKMTADQLAASDCIATDDPRLAK